MKRAVSYILLILVFFLVQNNIFAASPLIVTVPNLLLILVFSFGFMRGSLEGMLIGFACGLLSDVFFGSTIGFSALMYSILGYGIGLTRIALPELLYTGLMTLLLYPLLKKTEALIERWEVRKTHNYV